MVPVAWKVQTLVDKIDCRTLQTSRLHLKRAGFSSSVFLFQHSSDKDD